MRRLALIAGLWSLLVLYPAEGRGDTGNYVIGARPQGMGGAYTALSSGALGGYWNAAGLAPLDGVELAYSYWTISDVSNVDVNFAAVAVPIAAGSMDAAVGFSVVRVGAELEEGATAETSDISDSRYSVSGGLGVTRFLSVGLTLNRLQINSKRESGAGFSFDAGLQVKPLRDQEIYLGATGRNLSGEIKNEDLDESWRFGASGSFWQRRITVAGDVHLRRDVNADEGLSPLFYGGVEVAPVEALSLRFGGGSRSVLGFGIGVTHAGLSVDYALADDDDVFGASHRFSVSYRFPGRR